MGNQIISSLAKVLPSKQQLKLEYAGINLSAPWGLASGWADSLQKMHAIADLGAGAVVSKTIVINHQRGNPYPRFYRWQDSMVNSMGLPSRGLKWWLDSLQNNKAPDNFIFSVKGNSISEWKYLVKGLSKYSKIIELNFSCPNVTKGIIDLDTTSNILKEIRNSLSLQSKLFIKLSPEYSTASILNLLHSLKESSLIDGITCFNTMPVHFSYLGNPSDTGGLSGRPLNKKMVNTVKEIRKFYKTSEDLPIFSLGGIWDVQDVRKMIKLEALPFVLSAFLIQGPFLFKQWYKEIFA